jgi:hypothetical protein
MKKRYQIEQQRAVQRFRRLATEQKMIQVTITVQRFTAGMLSQMGAIAGVGGPIDIAVVQARHKIKWVARKELQTEQRRSNSRGSTSSVTGICSCHFIAGSGRCSADEAPWHGCESGRAGPDHRRRKRVHRNWMYSRPNVIQLRHWTPTKQNFTMRIRERPLYAADVREKGDSSKYCA